MGLERGVGGDTRKGGKERGEESQKHTGELGWRLFGEIQMSDGIENAGASR